jgi:FHS family Na+ dependent glucose MFS transporter 1
MEKRLGRWTQPMAVGKLAKLLGVPGFRHTLGYYGAMLCIGLTTAVLGPTLVALSAQTETRLGDMGQLFLCGAAGMALGILLGGRLLARFRGHSVLGAAAVATGLLALVIPSMPTFAGLLAVMAVKGLMDGITTNGVHTLLVWTHREAVSPYVSGLHFCFGLGALLSPLAVAQVIDTPGAYRWVYVGLGVVSIIVGLCIGAMAGGPQAARPVDEQSAADQPRRVPYKVAVAAAVYLFFYVGAEAAFGGWVFTYAVGLGVASAVEAAYLTSGFYLAFTVGRLLSVPLAIRLAPHRIIALALFGCVASIGLAIAFPDSGAVLWMAALGLGLCMGPLYASGFSLAVQDLVLTARESSIILLGDSFGMMVLPWLVGRGLEVVGPRALVYLVFSSLIGSWLAFVGLLQARRRALATTDRAEALRGI